MAPWNLQVEIRTERHFGERDVRCFAHRPASVYETFERACSAAPNDEALVCGETRLTYAELETRKRELRERFLQASR